MTNKNPNALTDADRKALEQHQTTRYVQQKLELFELLDDKQQQNERLSHTIELYDAIPKYVWDAEDSDQPSEITRTYQHRGTRISLTVIPAQITRDNKKIFVYPGQREEVVEDALRKLVVQGKGSEMGGEVVVRFSINELRQELAKHGRTYSSSQIKEALYVCQGSIVSISGDDGLSTIRSNIFPLVALTNRKEYLADSDAQCVVRFHPLVTKSIIDSTFRRYDYQLNLSIRNSLARYIHKRMSHYWTQASFNHTYKFKLVSFLERSPRGLSATMSENIRALKIALDSLKKHGVIFSYEENREMSGRKVVNIEYQLTPDERFVKDMKAFNFHANNLGQNTAEADADDDHAPPTLQFITWEDAAKDALPGESASALKKRFRDKGIRVMGGPGTTSFVDE